MQGELIPARMSNTIPDAPLAKPSTSIEEAVIRAIDSGRSAGELSDVLRFISEAKAMQARQAYAEAMAEFRRRCPNIQRQHVNPTYSRVKRDGTKGPGTYADLDDITTVINPICASLGLSYDWTDHKITDGHLVVTVTIRHVAGHSEMKQGPPIAICQPLVSKEGRAVQSPAQASAVTTTYAQRLALSAAFGLATTDADVDGNEEPANPPKRITTEQARSLDDLIIEVYGSLPDTGREWVKGKYKVATFAELTEAQFDEAYRMLDERRKHKAKGKP